MVTVVHIGLGKTATTSLQKYLFPEIPKLRKDIKFNDSGIMQSLSNIINGNVDWNDQITLSQNLAKENHFISNEALVDWNPRRWDIAADRNLELFGRDAKIIITVRDTDPYLRSVYQQMVHEGNIHSPEDFLISKEDYDQIEHLLAPGLLQRFDVDGFDLERLWKLYQDRFSNVYIVPLRNIHKLEFLRDLFDLSHAEHASLCQKFKRASEANKAYSSSAMWLTFLRSRILRRFGLSIRGSDVEALDKFRPALKVNKDFKLLGFRGKITQFPLRFILKTTNRFFRFFNWRRLMQSGVNRIIPYKKYQLPKSTYRNAELARKNDEFIARLSHH